MKITAKDGNEFLECDGCHRIERLNAPVRTWVRVPAFALVGPEVSGFVYEDETAKDKEPLNLDACTAACLRRAQARTAAIVGQYLRKRP